MRGALSAHTDRGPSGRALSGGRRAARVARPGTGRGAAPAGAGAPGGVQVTGRPRVAWAGSAGAGRRQGVEGGRRGRAVALQGWPGVTRGEELLRAPLPGRVSSAPRAPRAGAGRGRPRQGRRHARHGAERSTPPPKGQGRGSPEWRASGPSRSLVPIPRAALNHPAGAEVSCASEGEDSRADGRSTRTIDRACFTFRLTPRRGRAAHLGAIGESSIARGRRLGPGQQSRRVA